VGFLKTVLKLVVFVVGGFFLALFAIIFKQSRRPRTFSYQVWPAVPANETK
jgi:hypothetical protein